MFSSMIQNLLSTSGQTAAMQRAVQMNNHINSINSQWMPVHKTENMQQTPKTELSNFDKVLGASAQTKFGSLVSNPTVRVDAKLYTEKANSVAQKNDNDYSSKNKIKELISKISQKHGVDEKLVNALIKQVDQDKVKVDQDKIKEYEVKQLRLQRKLNKSKNI